MQITNPKDILIDQYNYNLPEDQIAKYPLAQRDSSKLLVSKGGLVQDSSFLNLPDHIPLGSLMIFNNTKVIQARLHFKKQTGAEIEIFCLEPSHPSDYSFNFQQQHNCSWICLIGNLKKWKEGELTKEIQIGDKKVILAAKRSTINGDSHLIEFAWNDDSISFADILQTVGELPIPPYLNRATEDSDEETYQTIYSKINGSVAAPTAGLHFTETVISHLTAKGIAMDEVTLHVGAGTFKPVKSELVKDHEMHSEFISVHKNTISRLINHKDTVIAVGTTSVRTLESLYYIGLLLENNPSADLLVPQWMPYDMKDKEISVEKSLVNILNYLEKNKQESLIASTQIMILPGYNFNIVDGIITNFHQPKSTLLLLISAFVGNNTWKNIYTHALENEYRFLSYGDSSLLLKKQTL